jgi:hypothetical protein
MRLTNINAKIRQALQQESTALANTRQALGMGSGRLSHAGATITRQQDELRSGHQQVITDVIRNLEGELERYRNMRGRGMCVYIVELKRQTPTKIHPNYK